MAEQTLNLTMSQILELANNNHVTGTHTEEFKELTVKDYMKDYTLIKESFEILTVGGFIAEELFTQGYSAQGGGVKYMKSNGQFVDTDADPEDFTVDEGGEPHQVYTSEEAPAFATVKKHYIEGWVTYEEERRNNLGALARLTTRMTNSFIRELDGRVMKLLRSHPEIPERPALTPWATVTGETLYDDLILAKADVASAGSNGFKYNANTLVVSENTFTNMLRNKGIRELFAPNNQLQSPYYTGQMGSLAGLTIMQTPYMGDDYAFVLQKGAIGGIADEVPFTVKPIEDDTRREKYFIRMKRETAAFVSDPGAMVRIDIV